MIKVYAQMLNAGFGKPLWKGIIKSASACSHNIVPHWSTFHYKTGFFFVVDVCLLLQDILCYSSKEKFPHWCCISFGKSSRTTCKSNHSKVWHKSYLLTHTESLLSSWPLPTMDLFISHVSTKYININIFYISST